MIFQNIYGSFDALVAVSAVCNSSTYCEASCETQWFARFGPLLTLPRYLIEWQHQNSDIFQEKRHEHVFYCEDGHKNHRNHKGNILRRKTAIVRR